MWKNNEDAVVGSRRLWVRFLHEKCLYLIVPSVWLNDAQRWITLPYMQCHQN